MSGDWHDSLFKSEKGDSLGDGSWGRDDEEPKLAPVAWDKLPDAPNKKKIRARLATPAPGSETESGLLDMNSILPPSTDEDSALGPLNRARAAAPAARLATPAKGSTGSGLIDVQQLVRLQEEKGDSEQSAKDRAIEVIAQGASTAKTSDSTRLASDPGTSASRSSSPTIVHEPSRTPLFIMMGILFAAVVGLAVYVVMH